MHHEHQAIPIVVAAAETDCDRCGGHAAAPACRANFGEPCAAPDLRGPDDLLRRALDSLRGVIDPERGLNLVDAHFIAALRIDADEAELTLTFAPGCGSGRLMAEAAFQSLRRVLPDTDIYVRHAT